MKESISARQVGIICAMTILANKILLLPSLLYQKTKADGIFVVALIFLFDLLVLWSFFALKKKFPTQSLNEILNTIFNKFITKIIYLAFLLFFMFKVFLTFSISFIYLKQQVYQGDFTLLAIVCVLPIINHATMVGLRSMTRTIEIFFYIVIFGFILCLAVSIFSFQTMPTFFTTSFDNFSSSIFQHIFSFGDYLFLFLIIDKINVTKEAKKTILRFSGFAIFLILALFFLFYSIYQITAFMHNNALSDVLVSSVIFNAVGRLDIIAMLTIMFLSIFQMEIFHYGFCDAFVNIFPKLNKVFAIAMFDILFFLVYVMLIGKYENMVMYVETWLPYLALFVDYFLPFLIFCFSYCKKTLSFDKKKLKEEAT